MGCGSSSAIDVKNSASAYQGQLIVKPLSGVLLDEHGLFGKMNPVASILFGSNRQQTPPCKGGNKTPKWTETFTFNKTFDEDVVIVECWNPGKMGINHIVGEGAFALTSIKSGGEKQFQVDLMNKGKPAGTITIDAKFTLATQSAKNPQIIAPNTKGQVVVKPTSATLIRSTDLVEAMSPMVTIRLQGETQSSQPCTKGGKDPIWKDILHFHREVTDDTFVIECWNFSREGHNDIIGIGYFSITSALPPNAVSKMQVPLL